MGGIGFFLGGIGPDGHIAFNIRGSDFFSTTRLIEPNYETRAAAASDLGGMEVSRTKHVITIGLQTITYNPDAVAIIIAAGEAKARIVANTIHADMSNEFPGSCLAVLPNARFYLTKGAAVRLPNRNFVDFTRFEKVPTENINKIVMELSLENDKPIKALSREDFNNDRFGAELLKKTQKSHQELRDQAHGHVIDALTRGNQPLEHKTFLHTAPHHDDFILAYLPYVTNLVRRSSTKHCFSYMTSGFNAVTNRYMYEVINDLLVRLRRGDFKELAESGYFELSNDQAAQLDVYYYLEGAARSYPDMMDEGVARRLLRNLMRLYEDDSIDNLIERCVELLNYFRTQYPGKKDMALVQQLKGRCREFESDLKWASYGFVGDMVRHLRLAFYKGDIFTEVPRVDRDVPPIKDLIEELTPDIVTCAFDPEGSGPDTHYKVLQAVSEALRRYEKESNRSDLRVVGYRNVWFRFHPSEANLYVPTSMTHLNDMEDCFLTCFNTQKDAEFPSYEHDGPFSRLARKIQCQQFEHVKTFLGEDFFVNHADHGMRACRGIVYLREMSLAEFYSKSEQLKHVAEET
jgi:glucosamine-6-phosphate deaminase